MIEVISIQRYLISNEACSRNANLHEVQENQRSMPRQGRKERINTQNRNGNGSNGGNGKNPNVKSGPRGEERQ
nr:hypothetical protein Iba_chr04bCG14290 [Ipomoea batatas]